MNTRLYLCRHGEVDGAGAMRYNGHKDVAMTARGVAQMETLRDRLVRERITGIFSSDLSRASIGAAIIGGPHGLKAASIPALRERNIGVWEGLTWDEIKGRWPEQWAAWIGDIVNFKPEGGESLLELSARIIPALEKLIADNAGGDIVLVGHGGVNRVILSHLLGMPLGRIFSIEQNFGCLNIIDFHEDGIPVVNLLNG